MIISHTMGHPGDGETGRREVRMKRMPVSETGRKEVEQLRREQRMKRMPVSETVKTLLVKCSKTIGHIYSNHMFSRIIFLPIKKMIPSFRVPRSKLVVTGERWRKTHSGSSQPR